VVAASALEGSGLLLGSLVRSFNLLLWAHQNWVQWQIAQETGETRGTRTTPSPPSMDPGHSRQRRGAINSPIAQTGHRTIELAAPN
jgi:hypothetical protein